MKFDNANALANHQKKFWKDSDYGTLNKLDEKLKAAASPISHPTVGKTKDNELTEAYFKDKANNNRFDDMKFELENYREERKKLKLEGMDQENKYLDQLAKLEKIKEAEVRDKFEKHQIKRALHDLDKEKLSEIKKEKQMELERFEQEKNLQAIREREVQAELNRIQGNLTELDKIYAENRNKVIDQGQKLKAGAEKEDIRQRLFEEKAERVSGLKARRDNLHANLNYIDKAIQNQKNGNLDREELARIQENINYGAQQHIDDVKKLKKYNKDNIQAQIEEEENDQQFDKIARRSNALRLAGFQSTQTLPKMVHQPPTYQNPPQESYDDYLQNQEDSHYQQPEPQNNFYHSNIDQTRAFDHYQPPRMDQNTTVNQFNANPRHQAQQPLHIQNNPERPEFSRRAHPAHQRPPPPPQYPPHQRPQPMGYPHPHPVPMPQQRPPPSIEKTFDDFLHQDFMQNQLKNVDLNEEERMLLHITQQEADALRMLSRIPQNSDLYRFKSEQYKELSTQRAEAEKLVNEHRLKKLKRGLEMRVKEEDRRFDNQKFVDSLRKNKLGGKSGMPQVPLYQPPVALNPAEPNTPSFGQNPTANLPSQLQMPIVDENPYKPEFGFVVHWDYVFGIPKNRNYCQVVYAITRGETNILEPQLVEPRPVQDQGVDKNQWVIYENDNVKEIDPDRNTILIIEVQNPTSLNDIDDYSSLGWTFINLFEVNRELNRGKFKLPLYQGPILKNVTKEYIDKLAPVLGANILFRISYPWKDEFSNLKNTEPHKNQGEYQIPPVHMKQAMKQGVLSRVGPQGRDQADYSQDESSTMARPIQVSRRDPEVNSNRNAPSTTTRPETPHELISKSKGVKVILHNVQNFSPNDKAKISLALMDEQYILRDDLDQDTRVYSSIHNPGPRDPNDGRNAGDKRAGKILKFEEEFNFNLNVPKHVKTNRRNVYLVIQVLEKADKAVNGDKSSYIKGSEFQMRGWYCHQLNEANGKVKAGTFEEYIYAPPRVKPPIDPNNMATLPQAIEFTVEDLIAPGKRM